MVRNFSSHNDGNGTWVDETSGFTDATGVFRMPFQVPSTPSWEKTTLDIMVSKEGYGADSDERTIWRSKPK